MRPLWLLLIAVSLGGEAFATPIVLTHSGTGSGTIGSTAFTSADFTITALADTVNRTPIHSGFSLEHDSAVISISGLGEFHILSPTRTFLSRSIRMVGFSHGGTPFGLDLFDGPIDPSFSTWDLVSPIGPVVGTGQLLQWDDPDVPRIDTDAGILFFAWQQDVPATFQATMAPEPIPEPGTLGLFALGLLGIAARSRASRCSWVA